MEAPFDLPSGKAATRVRDREGTMQYVSAAQVPGSPWIIVLSEPEQEVLSRPRSEFAARVAAQGRVGLTSALVARNLHVTMTLSNKGANMRALDAGLLRHQVFGNKAVWARQKVPAGAFRGRPRALLVT